MIPESSRRNVVKLEDQALGCEVVSKNFEAAVAGMRKAGLREAEARMLLDGVRAAGETIRVLIAERAQGKA